MPGRAGYSVTGGWATSSGGSSSPANLSISSRSGNAPSEYVASESVEFTPGFESGVSDAFDAYLGSVTSTGGNGSGSSYASGGYRYGFNAKEREGDMTQESYDFGARVYDGRIGRFLTKDRFGDITFYKSTYSFAGNSPINSVDANGDIKIIVNVYNKKQDGTYVQVATHIKVIETVEDVRGIDRTPLIVNMYTTRVSKQITPQVVEEKSKLESWSTDKKTGLTRGEDQRDNGNFDDRVSYYAYKFYSATPLTNVTIPLAEAQSDRDFWTGEYQDEWSKGMKYVSAALNAVSFGRGASAKSAVTNAFKKYFVGALKDALVEEIISVAMSKLDLPEKELAGKAMVLGYYITNLKRGGLSLQKVKEQFDEIAKVTQNSTDFVKALKDRLSLDLNKPLDRNAAAQQAVQEVQTEKGYEK